MQIKDVFVENYEATMDGGPYVVGERATFSLALVCRVPIRPAGEVSASGLAIAGHSSNLEKAAVYRATGKILPMERPPYAWNRLIEVQGITLLVDGSQVGEALENHRAGSHITAEGTVSKVQGYLEDFFEHAVRSMLATDWRIEEITPIVEHPFGADSRVRGGRIQSTWDPAWVSASRGFLLDLSTPEKNIKLA
jgi:hypothetical protein